MSRVVGRLAPSPTGLLHLGNARSLLLAWLGAKSVNGKIFLRVEDLLPDVDRHLPGMLEDLHWLGLECDPWAQPPGFMRQSERKPIYDALLTALQARGRVYPCVCTRKDIDLAARAPHREDQGLPYPGTCRGRFTNEHEALEFEQQRARRENRPPLGVALRMVVPETPVKFHDAFHGPQSVHLPSDCGDFVVRRKDGVAYMFAVVVDDVAMNVNQVVRGDDLLAATAQQLVVLQSLAELSSPILPGHFTPPQYIHVPLVLGDDGRRLAKRNQSLHLGALRQEGMHAADLVAWLGRSLGLEEAGDVNMLARQFAWEKVPKNPVIFGEAELRSVLGCHMT